MTPDICGAIAVIALIAVWALVLSHIGRKREQYEARWIAALEENDGYGHAR